MWTPSTTSMIVDLISSLSEQCNTFWVAYLQEIQRYIYLNSEGLSFSHDYYSRIPVCSSSITKIDCITGQLHLWNYISNCIFAHTCHLCCQFHICNYKEHKYLFHGGLQLPYSANAEERSYITVVTPLMAVLHFGLFRSPDMHGRLYVR